MMSVRRTAALGGVVLAGSLALAAPGAAASGSSASPGKTERAWLVPLNNSGVMGNARVTLHGNRAEVVYNARGLLAGMPHAAHLHFAAQARHECPTVRDDTNQDHRLSTAEGLPAYGPIQLSLTTRGDTSPASGLAVSRFPVAPKGMVHYDRWVKVSPQLAQAITKGQAVLVVHGLDYNQNGKYDFAGAGKSELDPNLPAEATDPAACGVLR